METYIRTARDHGLLYVRLIYSIRFCICSTCEANISDVFLYSSIVRLASSSSTHCFSIKNFCRNSYALAFKYMVEELLALAVLRDLGLGPQPPLG